MRLSGHVKPTFVVILPESVSAFSLDAIPEDG